MVDQGREIKRLVKAKGFTLLEFADKLGLSYSTMMSKLNGYTTLDGPFVSNVGRILEETPQPGLSLSGGKSCGDATTPGTPPSIVKEGGLESTNPVQ
jgi:transcriptional regulator with XRE-family HTH domain